MINLQYNYIKRLKFNMILRGYKKDYIYKCCKYASRLLDKNLPVIFDKRHLYEILKLDGINLDSYHIFEIPSSHEQRLIFSPSLKIKTRQKWILKNILEKIQLPEYIHGFVKGKSIYTNAQQHLNKEEILCLDIKNFFSSININDVEKIFYDLGYNKEVAKSLSLICTFNNGILPTGAPTSPYLANICFLKVDNILNKYAGTNGLTYTRYADDMTFSGNCSLLNHKETIINIVSNNKFTINQEKTHIMTGKHRKIVTGLIVTDIVKVPKSFKRALRQEIYYCNKFGVEYHLEVKKNSIHSSSSNKQFNNYKAINYKEYLYGKAYFIKMIEKEVGEKFLIQLDKIFGSTYDTIK